MIPDEAETSKSSGRNNKRGFEIPQYDRDDVKRVGIGKNKEVYHGCYE
jgi:hypothetical protein